MESAGNQMTQTVICSVFWCLVIFLIHKTTILQTFTHFFYLNTPYIIPLYTNIRKNLITASFSAENVLHFTTSYSKMLRCAAQLRISSPFK